MTPRSKKLRLSRETLRQLSTEQLAAVAGGVAIPATAAKSCDNLCQLQPVPQQPLPEPEQVTDWCY